ncbi:MAG: alpha/beta hydrolase [Sciscionella sp.]
MPTPRRSRFPAALLLVFVAVLLGVTACSGSGSKSPKAATPTTEKRGPAGTVPAGLAKFYGQPLSWGPCGSYATGQNSKQLYENPQLQCARLSVPLDYADPKGQTITLGLLRKQASGSGHRIGSLVINPGGPGESGMEAAASLAKQVSGSRLGSSFDLVGFDPRGIGSSRPAIDCLTDAEQDKQRAEDLDDDTSPAGVARAEAQQRSYAKDCRQRTKYGKEMLANLGTKVVARDMDVLRSALGDKKLTYVGFSYGTRIGSTYAEEFPAEVRAMVLDGAVDPSQTQAEQSVAQARGFQHAFDSFAAWCAKQRACALGKDPSRAVAAFQALTRPLLEHPADVGDGRKLTYDDATTGAIQALYSKKFWPILNSALNQLTRGSGRTLMLLADTYDERDQSGHYATTQDAFTAVHCVDDPRLTDPSQLLAMQRAFKQAAPFLDNGRPAVAEQDACSYWPVPATGKPHLPKVAGLAPTLVISTTHDPATPYQAGVNLAKALHGGLLTNEGTQHTAFLQGNSCVDTAAINYLINLKLPPAGKRCTSS